MDPADPDRRGGMIGPGTGVRVYLACGVTDMRRGIAGLPQPDEQVVSHNLLSRAARAMLPFPRPEWLNFRVDYRTAVGEIDLIALAYLDLPDVARIFPNKAVSAPRFRATAALGRLSRGLLTRIAAIVQDQLRQKPAGGSVFAFRGRRGDRIKILYFDGQGFCLYYKILEKGRFPWPSPVDGTARLTSAQLAMLWEGIDWRRPSWGAPPQRFS